MKLIKDGICNDVEFTLDDMREAMTDYYLKKAKEDPSLRVDDAPHPTCGVVTDMPDYENLGASYVQDTPNSGHLRWIDKKRARDLSLKAQMKRRLRQGLDTRIVAHSSPGHSSDPEHVRWEVLKNRNTPIQGSASDAFHFEVSKSRKREEALVYLRGLGVPDFIIQGWDSAREESDSYTAYVLAAVQCGLPATIQEFGHAAGFTKEHMRDALKVSANLPPADHAAAEPGLLDVSQEEKTITDGMLHALGVDPEFHEEMKKKHEEHKEGICCVQGCSAEAWTRPNGTKKFCTEHETEEFTYKKTGLTLL